MYIQIHNIEGRIVFDVGMTGILKLLFFIRPNYFHKKNLLLSFFFFFSSHWIKASFVEQRRGEK